jgi:hypothetical protein
MKKIIITLGLLISQLNSQSQQFINGELNPVGTDYQIEGYFNMSSQWFNTVFEGASWWGNAKLATFINEPNNFAIGINFFNEGNFYQYANFSMELDQPLIPGVKYRLSYEEKDDLDTPMIIEGSYFKNTPGIEIGQTSTPNTNLNEWKGKSIEFTAADTFRFFNFILDYEASAFPNSGRALDKFNLEIIEDTSTDILKHPINILEKYTVYSIEGKLLYNNILINELEPGFYILENNNQTFKLIK